MMSYLHSLTPLPLHERTLFRHPGTSHRIALHEQHHNPIPPHSAVRTHRDKGYSKAHGTSAGNSILLLKTGRLSPAGSIAENNLTASAFRLTV